jgi:hypothetical protein
MPRMNMTAPPNQVQLPFSHLLCRYRNKVCTHPRALKRDGLLHRYCEEHRQRANTNQKKWIQRRILAVEGSQLQGFQPSYPSMQEQAHTVLNARWFDRDNNSIATASVTLQSFEASIYERKEGNPLELMLPQSCEIDLTFDSLWGSFGLGALENEGDSQSQFAF